MKKIRIMSLMLAIIMLATTVLSSCSLFPVEEPHEHTYAEDWAYDKNEHWHAASCEHTEERADVGAHVDEEKVDAKCDVCGAQLDIPNHAHADEDMDGECDVYGEQVYSVVFKNGETVVSKTIAAPGEFVDVPADLATPEGSRDEFQGWLGLSDAEIAAGKVEVFYSNLVFDAKWYESFGTDKVVELVEVRDATEIVADGIMDEAYADAKPITIASDRTDTTATAYVLWSAGYFYIFVDVKDSTENGSDFVELRFDLLHTDEFANPSWTGGWSDQYRGQASVEGGWKLYSGSTTTEKYWEYWSHLTNERNSAFGKTVRNSEGYTAEWVIKVEDNGFEEFTNKGVNLYPHLEQEIGIGILVHDEGKGWAGIDNFDGYNSRPKCLSNAVLIDNETMKNHEHTFSDSWTFDEENHWYAAECWHKTEKKDLGEHVDLDVKDGKCDVCGAPVEIPEHVHADANLDGKCDEYGEAVYTVVFKNGDTILASYCENAGAVIDIPASDTLAVPYRHYFNGWSGINADVAASGKITVNSDLTVSAKWKEQFGTDLVVDITEARNNNGITADGIMDAAYLDATPMVIKSDRTDTTATAYVLWSSGYYYVFVDVKDSTQNGSDFVELRLELLHTDKYASDDWNGSWGGHRKDAASEGGWKLYSGSTATECYWEYWSNLNRERNSAFGKTVRNSEGYTAEWVIKVEDNGFGSVEENLYPHIGQEIGLGILVHDEGKGWAGVENFDGYNSNVKRLTNATLVKNDNKDTSIVNAEVKSVRAYHDYKNQSIRDTMFSNGRWTTDYSTINVGESSLKALWSEDTLYIRPTLGANTKSMTIVAGGNEYTVGSSEIAIPGSFALNGSYTIKVTYQDGEDAAITTDYVLDLVENPYSRNEYTISKLDGTIEIDGKKDAAYDDEAIYVGVVTEGGSTATGEAYLKWSDEYLYVLVIVTDDSVTPANSQKGDPSQNDSVELWINTCRTLPANGWGEIRPSGDYCGEGGFRVQTNNNVTGSHWMYDWRDGVPRTTAVAFTETGYAVEYKIHFSAFAGVSKVGQHIDLMININDDDNNDGSRNGMTSLNTRGIEAWEKPWVLDRFLLVE